MSSFLSISFLSVIHQLSANAHQCSVENAINSAQDFYRVQIPCSSMERRYLDSYMWRYLYLLLDFSLTVKAETLVFISGCGSAISSAKEGKSGFIYNLVKS